MRPAGGLGSTPQAAPERRGFAACHHQALDASLAVVYNNLAATVEKLGQPREAQALYRHAIAICNESLSPDHPRRKHIEGKLKELEAQLFTFPGLEPPPPAIGRPHRGA